MKSYNMKHLHMRIFHKHKIRRLEDYNKNEFHLILPAVKTNANKFFV